MVSAVVKRAFRFRFYPTDAQAAELTRTFGCVRKVYNLALAARIEAWDVRGERLGYNATSALLTTWKKSEELAYLNDVSCVPLQQALRHLQTGYAAFWDKRTRRPRFKSRKKSRASAEYTKSAFRYREGRLILAKMAEPLNVIWSRSLPDGAEPSTVTVSCDQAGRWFVSLLCEDRSVQPLPCERIADRRRNHLHELTTRLVRENQTLVLEDLAVRNLIKGRALARVISDAGWREFRTMLEYKANWYGRELIVIDRWFPSSKLCSSCGALASSMPLHVRVWICDECGVSHDRDVNAAKNLLAAG